MSDPEEPPPPPPRYVPQLIAPARLLLATWMGIVLASAAYGVYKWLWSTSDDKKKNTKVTPPTQPRSATPGDIEAYVSQQMNDVIPAAATTKGVAPTTSAVTGAMSKSSEELPFLMTPYKDQLSSLHQCFCMKRQADDGSALSRCSQCKATYYCSSEHQKHAWSNAPMLHRTFCPNAQRMLRQGYSAIAEFMLAFTPSNAQNMHPSMALEGWTVASAALEKELYANDYEEGRLLVWAGMTHVMMVGQTLSQDAMNMKELLKRFGPAMNFFLNAIEVGSRSERSREVVPFAQFELFGLWSLVASTFQQTDFDRQHRMFARTAVEYGVPAVEGLVELLSSDADYEWTLGMQYLGGWVQGLMFALMSNPVSADKAASVVRRLEQFAEDVEYAEGSRDVCMLATIFYESGLAAARHVETESGLLVTEWGQPQYVAYAAKMEEITRQRVQQG